MSDTSQSLSHSRWNCKYHQQFPVSSMVYPAYTPYDAPHVGLQTPRRLCLVQLKSATGDMGDAGRLLLVDAYGALFPTHRLITGRSCEIPAWTQALYGLDPASSK